MKIDPKQLKEKMAAGLTEEQAMEVLQAQAVLFAALAADDQDDAGGEGGEEKPKTKPATKQAATKQAATKQAAKAK